MSILTKFLVVLVTILSIVLVALVVPFMATQDDLSQQLQDTKNQLASAKTTAAVAQAELSQVLSQSSDEIKLLNQTIAERTADLESEKAAKVQAQAQAKQAEAQMAELKASYQSLAATQGDLTETNRTLGDQLSKAQQTIQTQGTRLLELADANDELTAEVNTLVRRVNQFQEQGVALRERLAEAQEKLDAIPTEVRKQYLEEPTEVAATRPQQPIAGQVVAVEDLGNGVVLVQINVGQSDQVSKGMEFLVHKGEDFKGTLVIDRVEPRRSVGKMQLVKADIQKGDEVYTGPY